MQKIVESRHFENFIVLVILLNAVVLGLETSSSISAPALKTLNIIDTICLIIFICEIFIKLVVYRLQFFRDPWRIFDFLVVGASLLPSSGPLSILRSLRVLRVLRMISVVPSLRKVISGLLISIPGLGAVGAVMALIFYVFAVMATKLFGAEFPQWFGSFWESSYTLFQIMTLESWSMGIVRPVMEKYPLSALFFIPFIVVTTFTTLNLFIAVIVNAMQAETDAAAEQRAEESHAERLEMLKEIKELKVLVKTLVER